MVEVDCSYRTENRFSVGWDVVIPESTSPNRVPFALVRRVKLGVSFGLLLVGGLACGDDDDAIQEGIVFTCYVADELTGLAVGKVSDMLTGKTEWVGEVAGVIVGELASNQCSDYLTRRLAPDDLVTLEWNSGPGGTKTLVLKRGGESYSPLCGASQWAPGKTIWCDATGKWHIEPNG